MKQFYKVFFISLLCIALMVSAGAYTYLKFFNSDEIEDFTVKKNNEWVEKNKDNEIEITPLQEAIKNSKRINILILGMEDKRTDTIMLVSFDKDSGKTNIISIPRDTYFYRTGYESSGSKKINAVYTSLGPRGVMKSVENILKIPVHNYVSFDYEAVKKTIDVIGGVQVDIPFDMKYKDPYDDPPLIIDLKSGLQVLDGEKSLQYLRFRHNNDMTVGYNNGDIGRIAVQQQFIKSAIKKILSFKLPAVINEVYSYLSTDLIVSEILSFTKDAVKISQDNIEMTILPGRAADIEKISFYLHDPKKVKEYIENMYEVNQQ